MARNDMLANIFRQFDLSAKEYCSLQGGLGCEITSDYKGDNTPENLVYRFAKLYFNGFCVVFKYTAHGIMNAVNSILECLIYPGKSENTVGVPLPFVTDHCDIDTLSPMFIPFISDESGMAQAFSCIEGVLDKLLPRISEIVYNDDTRSELLSYYYGEIEAVFGVSKHDEVSSGFYQSDVLFRFITNRFTSNAFLQALKGNKSRALKLLSQQKSLFRCEKRMLRLWQNADVLQQLPAVEKNLDTLNKLGAAKMNPKEFFAVFVSVFILAAGISVVYVGAFMLVYIFEKSNAVYLMGSMRDLPSCFFAALISGFVLSYFTRFRFFKWMFKKDYENYAEMEAIMNSPKSDRFMKYFAAVIVVFSLAACVLLPKHNIKFTDKGFTANTDFFSLSGEYHSYSEIDSIYYLPERVNGFGKTLQFPSYVMALQNGEEFDFYEYEDIDDYETELLDFLREQGVRVIKSNQRKD